MPRGDRTGSLGEGPMTGLKRGYCADNNTSFFGGFGFGRGAGRGMGRGAGFGRGLGWRGNNENTQPETESGLKATIDVLKEQLSALENRLQNLKSKE